MEYQIFNLIRHKYRFPFFLRIIIAILFLIFAIPQILLPIYPGSIIVGTFMLTISILLFISGRRVRHVIKLRKGIIYLFANIFTLIIIKYKIRDIKKHVGKILKEKKK